MNAAELKAKLAGLSESDRAAAQSMLDALLKRKRERKFWTMYPDAGPYRRELYPKHMEFISNGATYIERCFLAANRCITPWTWVDTRDQSTGLAHEVFGDLRQCVVAWDGEREETMCSGALALRKIAPAYRVVLDDGQFFDCCRKHQVLTTEGWTSLGQLRFPEGGRRYTHRVRDFQANCAKDGYLHDPRLLAGLSIGQVSIPSQVDALGLTLAWSRKDALERTREYRRACLRDGLDPTTGDPSQLAALYAQFSAPAMLHNALPRTWRCKDGRRFQPGSFLSREAVAVDQRLEAYSLVLDDLSLYESCTSPVLLDELPIEQLFPSTAALEIELANEQAPSDELLISVFEPFCHTPLVGGRSIVAIVPIGYQPIIDTTIPRYNNYKAGGVFHHNSGKTVVGAYETVCHATGRYPPWWKGKRFAQPTRGWVAGDTAKTVRDIGQRELLGSPQQFGTGMIPGEDIIRATPKAGVPDAIDTIYVKHYDSSGEQDGVSEIGLKSYDQGRIAFQGTEQDYIWLDEECPMEVYIECLMRTMTTGGIIYLTFTPLRGITEVVLLFMPGGKTQ